MNEGLRREVVQPPAKVYQAMTFEAMSMRHTRIVYRIVFVTLGSIAASDILIRIVKICLQ